MGLCRIKWAYVCRWTPADKATAIFSLAAFVLMYCFSLGPIDAVSYKIKAWRGRKFVFVAAILSTTEVVGRPRHSSSHPQVSAVYPR